MNSAVLSTDKQASSAALRLHLCKAKALRQLAQQAPATAHRRQRLREWQAARLERTYHDLLNSKRFSLAARFFLTDLYGPKDFSSRDDEIERILPLLTRLLPASAINTIALAIEVDALTEELDAATAEELAKAGLIDRIDEASYCKAYLRVGRRPERERQIKLIRQTGDALQMLANKSFLSGLLKLMQQPAQLAGLSDLHSFLEHGLAAFRAMGKASSEFLECIEQRENALLDGLFSRKLVSLSVQETSALTPAFTPLE